MPFSLIKLFFFYSHLSFFFKQKFCKFLPLKSWLLDKINDSHKNKLNITILINFMFFFHSISLFSTDKDPLLAASSFNPPPPAFHSKTADLLEILRKDPEAQSLRLFCTSSEQTRSSTKSSKKLKPQRVIRIKF